LPKNQRNFLYFSRKHGDLCTTQDTFLSCYFYSSRWVYQNSHRSLSVLWL